MAIVDLDHFVAKTKLKVVSQKSPNYHLSGNFMLFLCRCILNDLTALLMMRVCV